MAKYRKKPVVIEADQWHPGKSVNGVKWEPPVESALRDGSVALTHPARPYVVTIHGQRAYLAPGDWVITEPDGEHHYPCKPDIFESSYEPVTSTAQEMYDFMNPQRAHPPGT